MRSEQPVIITLPYPPKSSPRNTSKNAQSIELPVLIEPPHPLRRATRSTWCWRTPLLAIVASAVVTGNAKLTILGRRDRRPFGGGTLRRHSYRPAPMAIDYRGSPGKRLGPV